ncbi:MAG TPA: TolC family protein [Gemmatimonadales bacterium]
MSWRHLAAPVLLIALRVAPLGAQAQLNLEDALREAHAANAQLPLAALETRIAAAALRESRAAWGPRFSLDGDLHGGSPAAYAANDGRLQLLAEQPIYDGGALRAGIALQRALAGASQARFRQAEKDLDLAVRVGFAQLLELDTVIAVRGEGIARLQTYRSAIEARRAAGEGVSGDLLRTQVQLGQAEADLADAIRQRDLARLALNDLLGRDPNAPLTVAEETAPSAPPADTIAEAWSGAPEVRQAEAQVAAARSGTSLAAVERRPRLGLEVNAGTQPTFGTSGGAFNNGRGSGVEFLLSLSWPLLDAGGYRARRDQARLRLAEAQAGEVATRRQARLAWAAARAELAARYAEVETRRRTAATALDSYLSSESLYRGGAATALEVLDAYGIWIAASEAVGVAVLSYRVAVAQLERWGEP